MVDRTLMNISCPGLLMILALAGCGSSNEGTTDAGTGSASSTGGDSGSPTTDVPTGDVPGTTSEPGTGSVSGTETNATTVEPATGTDTSATTVEPMTGSDTGDSSTGAVSSDGTSTGDGASTSTTDAASTGDDSSSTGDGCVKTEPSEVTCDDIDNDCDGNVDNIDAGGDGICDCLNIAILGDSGFAPNANFEAWLEDQGTAVQRTKLLNNPGVVTPAFLAKFDLVLVDRIERALAPDEAAALAKFVKDDGRGMITLIGYNFDNNNPAPERDRANTVLSPFGLAYQGPYFGNGVIPTFDQNHPISKGIFDVNFAGGIEPVDTGKQGTSAVFATVEGKTGGLAHQTAMMGGRVIVWGDEWLTFDSDWQGYADVQEFWVNMVKWAKPQDFCGVPQ